MSCRGSLSRGRLSRRDRLVGEGEFEIKPSPPRLTSQDDRVLALLLWPIDIPSTKPLPIFEWDIDVLLKDERRKLLDFVQSVGFGKGQRHVENRYGTVSTMRDLDVVKVLGH
jgi:hypothetical protein